MIPSNVYTATIQAPDVEPGFTRADIQFRGIDHAGASYEGRVFVGRADADASTEKSSANGYVGSFHIFGHGGCFGDEGHCDITTRRRYDPRPEHPLASATKTVTATEAVRAALSGGGAGVEVTVVCVVTSLNPKCSADDAMRFTSMRLLTYR